jgi:hypothetical protein
MKISWGKGLTAAIIFFMLVTILLVAISMNTKFDLVTDNYYEKDLKYQQVIDKIESSNALESKVELVNHPGAIEIIFPPLEKNITGEVLFYRPSDASKDLTLPISSIPGNRMMISSAHLQKGFWKVKINWATAEGEYYFEESLIIK